MGIREDREARTAQPLATPEDIAAMAVFLASDRAANVTGQTVNVTAATSCTGEATAALTPSQSRADPRPCSSVVFA